MPVVSTDAAECGLMAMYVFDMYQETPSEASQPRWQVPMDSRLAQAWTLVGYVTGVDTFFHIDRRTDFYGVLLAGNGNGNAGPSELALVIRGTEGLDEWLEDADAHPIPTPDGKGTVEQGFDDIFQTMNLWLVSDLGTPISLIDGLVTQFESNKATQLSIIGHSLGSALGTLISYYLAGSASPAMLGQCDVLLLASPLVGDQDFADDFNSRWGGRYLVYNYENDIVPTLPRYEKYCQLPAAKTMSTSEVNAVICDEIPCNHHALCYCAMLDYETAMGATLTSDEEAEKADCIKSDN